MIHTKKLLFFKNEILKHKVMKFCNIVNENLSEWHKIKSRYSVKQQSFILNTLNKSNVIEMTKYGISESQIQKIESIQNEKKTFSSLDDFIALDIMNTSQMETVCSTILPLKEKKSIKKSSIVTPPLSLAAIENLKTAVGLRIGTSHISWCNLELTGSNCNILNSESHRISDLPLNSNLDELIKTGKNFAESIPEADAYVIEKESSRQMTKINTANFRIILRQQQFLSIILTILSTRENVNKTDKNFFDTFYMLRPFASAQLFDLFLGNETVSATDAVDALLQQQNVVLKNITSLLAENKFSNYYASLDQYRREELNRTLLITLTFFESAVLDRV